MMAGFKCSGLKNVLFSWQNWETDPAEGERLVKSTTHTALIRLLSQARRLE